MTFRKLAASSLVATALAFACASGLAQNAVGPAAFAGAATGAMPMSPSMPGSTTDFGPLASDTEGRAVLQQIEAKWGTLMRDVFNWNDSSFDQFYTGYRNYPVSVLKRALAASTYEAMDDELMTYASAMAQKNAGQGFNFAKTTTADISKDALELRKTAYKALGDDAKDLIFIPTSPCTVWDTRFASGNPYGPAIGNGVTREFYSHWNGSGGDFSAYGGNPSCSENNVTFLGTHPYAVMMIVYVSNATTNGWLTFYRDGDADPSQATISVYYAPGPTRTQTVVTKSNRGYGIGSYDIAVTGRFGTADASASVVGYFLKPAATALDCTTATSAMTAIPNNVWTVLDASCPAGYHVTGGGHYTSEGTLGYPGVWTISTPNGNGWRVQVDNQTGGARNVQAWGVCCRVPGH